MKYVLSLTAFLILVFKGLGFNVDSLYEVYKSETDLEKKFEILKQIYDYYISVENYQEAVDIADEAVKLAEQYDNSYQLAYALIWRGEAYYYNSNYDLALKDFIYGEKIATLDKNYEALLHLLNNIGFIYHDVMNKDSLGEIYYKKTYELAKQLKDTNLTIIALVNLAAAYIDQKLFDSARNALLEAERLAILSNDVENISNIKAKLAEVYEYTNQYEEALKKAKELLYFDRKIGIKQYYLALDYHLVARLFLALNMPDSAKPYIDSLGKLANTLVIKTRYFDILAEYFKQKRDYLNYAIALESVMVYNNQLMKAQHSKTIAELQTKYETAKKDKIIALQQAKIKNQRNLLTLGAITLLITIIFLTLLSTAYRKISKQKALLEEKNQILNQQKEEIETILEKLKETNEKLYRTNRELLESINYAKRIQQAVLPSEQIAKQIFKDYFVVYKPFKTVSGDFYYFYKKNNWIFFAVADCTGHGVPGGFMTMLGITLLDEIIKRTELANPATILELMRELLIEALEKHGQQIQDGIDLALCAYNVETKELRFSGANRPLYYFHNEELKVIKPDRQPIGKYRKIKPFSQHSIYLSGNEVIYLFTDGITDMFGGDNNEKFGRKRLEKLLIEIHQLPFAQQKEIIEKNIKNWIATGRQVDDILILGVKL